MNNDPGLKEKIMFEDVLKYQETQGQLIELENQINNSNAKKQVSKASAVVKDEQTKLRQIMARSESVKKDYEKNFKNYEKCQKEAAELLKTDIKGMDDSAREKLVNKSAELETTVEALMRALSVNNKDADGISREYEDIRKKINEVKVIGTKAKEQLAMLNAEVEPKRKALEKELATLEKTADKALLSKYKKLREDNIFPVFVSLLNNKCGGCHTDVSSAFVNKLKASGCLECEQCGKIVYFK